MSCTSLKHFSWVGMWWLRFILLDRSVQLQGSHHPHCFASGDFRLEERGRCWQDSRRVRPRWTVLLLVTSPTSVIPLTYISQPEVFRAGQSSGCKFSIKTHLEGEKTFDFNFNKIFYFQGTSWLATALHTFHPHQVSTILRSVDDKEINEIFKHWWCR